MAEKAVDLSRERLDHIKRDYDRARLRASRLVDRITSIRTWNITVIVAYLGWMTRPKESMDILPLLGAISLFWLMEALARALERFYANYTLKADDLFSKKTVNEFNQSLEAYTFLSKASDSSGKEWFTKKGKVHRGLTGLLDVGTVAFYILPLLILADFHPYTLAWRICLIGLLLVLYAVRLQYDACWSCLWSRLCGWYTRWRDKK